MTKAGPRPAPEWRRFALVVGPVTLALVGLYLARVELPFLAPLGVATAEIAGRILALSGIETLRAGDVLSHPSGFGYQVAYSCTGLFQWVFLVAGLLGLRLTGRSRWLRLLVGTGVLAAVNQLRLVVLFWLGLFAPHWFDFAHEVLFRSLMLAVVLLVWFWRPATPPADAAVATPPGVGSESRSWGQSMACLGMLLSVLLAAPACAQPQETTASEQAERELISLERVQSEVAVELRQRSLEPVDGAVFQALTEAVSREQILSQVPLDRAEVGGFFDSAEGLRLLAILQDPAVSELQVVRADLAALREPSGLIEERDLGNTASLLGFEVLDPRFSAVGDHTVAWQGSLAGENDGDLVLVVDEVGVSGLIRRGSTLYSVVPMGGELHAITSSEPAVGLRSLDDAGPPGGEAGDVDSGDQAETPPGENGAGAEATAPDDEGDEAPVADDAPDLCAAGWVGPPVEIEILVGATALAREQARRRGRHLDTLIQLAKFVADTTFSNSEIPVTVRLVGIESVDYEEECSQLFQCARDLARPVESLEKLIERRRETKADVVILVLHEEDDTNCGWASGIGVEAGQALAVVNWQCLNDRFSFIHEVGHLIGAWHNQEAITSPLPKDPRFAHGFVDCSENPFSTVMGASNSCPGGVGRLLAWSNPAVPHAGRATGVKESSDVACLWSLRAREVAGFGEQLTN